MDLKYLARCKLLMYCQVITKALTKQKSLNTKLSHSKLSSSLMIDSTNSYCYHFFYVFSITFLFFCSTC